MSVTVYPIKNPRGDTESARKTKRDPAVSGASEKV